MAAAVWAVLAADGFGQGLDRPLRSIHNGGNWAFNQTAADRWEADPSEPLLPPSFVDWVESLHLDWVGISVALHVDDSMDSTVERKHSGVHIPTFTDDALRQIIREYRQHGIDVYLTLAFEAHEALHAARPLARYLIGDPGDPEAGAPVGAEVRIDPANWPWSPSHPDHARFVAEFWRTYTAQAVHFARLAQEEGVRMFSLGTETDSLFRTRGNDEYWRNDFLRELRKMVAGVRAVFDGLVTYDMHYTAVVHDHYAAGSRHLWSDLDLDVVGVSAWFPPTGEPPTTVLSVDTLRREYDRIFRDHVIPAAARNERPVVFLEYGIVDKVGRPFEPDPAFTPFSDRNGNGLDDGQEQQANTIEAMLRTVTAYPGVVYGAFFWDHYIVSAERWAQHVADAPRGFSFRGKLAERVVRRTYDRFGELRWLPAKQLFVGGGAHVVPVELPGASSYKAMSSAPEVAAVTVSGSRVTVRPVSEGAASVTVTGDGAADTLQFTVAVLDFEAERGALEALYRATGGDDWTDNANWLSAAPFEDWYGVEVDQAGHVTGLRLGGWDESAARLVGNGLAGSLPARVGDLAHLRYLSLAGNELTGPAPLELGRLTNLLELDLNGNALTGTIPPTLANLTSLQGLSLWGHSWTSEPAPAWLGQLTGLVALDLGGHRLTGPIPATWRNLRDIEYLYLWGNRLTGPIPSWFGSLSKLRTLNLAGNALTGPLPASLTRLSDLVDLDISGTGVCVPDDPAIRAWLARIPRFISSGLTCAGSPPAAAATLPNRTLEQGGTLDVDLSRAFVDPDGDPLTYTVSSSAPHLVAAQVAGTRLRLTALGAGTATILVTAADPGGLSATQAFTATVTPAATGSFTDHPIVAGVTPLKVVHFMELRSRIDGVREAAGLPRFGWTDPVLRPGATPVRLVHLSELRSAVAAAYAAVGRAVPPWTDASPTAGETPIRAAHVTELRAAVVALE